MSINYAATNPDTMDIYNILTTTKVLQANTTPEPVDECWSTEVAPTTEEMLKHMSVVGYVLLPLCSALTVVCLGIFIQEIIFLNKNFCGLALAGRRRKTLVVLSVYPMFAITSLTVLWVPRSVVLMELTSSSFFAFILYTFLHLIPDYYGGRDKMFKTLDGCEVSRRKPPVCCCCLCIPHAKFEPYFFMRTKFLILQFALVKPVLTFVAAVMWTNGSYNPGSGDFQNPTIYIQIVMNVSTSIAVYGMLVFMGVAAPNLPKFHLKPKFYSVQLVLITTTLFGLIINIVSSFGVIPCLAPFSSKARASNLTHMIYIMEMVPLSVLGRFFYLRQIEYTKQEDEEGQEDEMQTLASGENGRVNAFPVDIQTTQPVTSVSGIGPPIDYHSEV